MQNITKYGKLQKINMVNMNIHNRHTFGGSTILGVLDLNNIPMIVSISAVQECHIATNKFLEIPINCITRGTLCAGASSLSSGRQCARAMETMCLRGTPYSSVLQCEVNKCCDT